MKKENRFPYGKRPFSSSPYNKLCQLVSMLHLRKRPGKYRICIAHKPLESTFPMRGATAKHQFSVPLLKLESTLPMRGATYSVQFSYIHHSYLNPRSPCGERLFLHFFTSFFEVLESTLPMRGATVGTETQIIDGILESTLPMRGATIRCDR